MNQQEAKKLIDNYVHGIATPEERKLVEKWYQSKALKNKLNDNDEFEHLSDELWEGTLRRANLLEIKKTFGWRSVAAIAATLTFFILTGIYFLPIKHTKVTSEITHAVYKKNEILPGGNKAILTLANGKQISLSDEREGTVAKENNTEISKTGAGQVKYKARSADNMLSFNTLATPLGGQYTVVLSDGTKVTLNATSTLRYPTSFSGKSREVELSGEGYFEVAHNSSMPFRVISKGQTIEVLGTHFNINCYENEMQVKTTLVEGSVKVIDGEKQVLLKPGEQSQLVADDLQHKVTVTKVNTDEVIAWKYGLFEFKDATVKDVMRCAARWYDVTVVYPGATPQVRISGRMSRNVNFSGLVQLLQFEGVKFNIKGKIVEVTD